MHYSPPSEDDFKLVVRVWVVRDRSSRRVRLGGMSLIRHRRLACSTFRLEPAWNRLGQSRSGLQMGRCRPHHVPMNIPNELVSRLRSEITSRQPKGHLARVDGRLLTITSDRRWPSVRQNPLAPLVVRQPDVLIAHFEYRAQTGNLLDGIHIRRQRLDPVERGYHHDIHPTLVIHLYARRKDPHQSCAPSYQAHFQDICTCCRRKKSIAKFCILK